MKLCRGRGGGLVDRAADSGPYDPSSIPIGEKKENNKNMAWLGLAPKKTFPNVKSKVTKKCVFFHLGDWNMKLYGLFFMKKEKILDEICWSIFS